MILRAVNFGEFEALERLCKALWHETYDALIGEAQVCYMLEKFQSKQAFYKQMKEENYRYFFIVRENDVAGYVALKLEEKRLFLSKLYLKKEYRGTGLVKDVLQEIFEAARHFGYKEVYLTVNKHNARAVAAYKKYGFCLEECAVSDIGGGYVMDDYIYKHSV